MYEAGDKVFYYITVMNEPYAAAARCLTESKRGSFGACIDLTPKVDGGKRVCVCSAAARFCARCWPRPICCEEFGVSAARSGA